MGHDKGSPSNFPVKFIDHSPTQGSLLGQWLFTGRCYPPGTVLVATIREGGEGCYGIQ